MTEALDTTVHPSKISSDALDQLFRGPYAFRMASEARARRNTPRSLRTCAQGSDKRDFESPPLCLSPKRSCKGTPSARARSPQCRKKQKQQRSPSLSLGTPSSMRDFHRYFPTPPCAPIS